MVKLYITHSYRILQAIFLTTSSASESCASDNLCLQSSNLFSIGKRTYLKGKSGISKSFLFCLLFFFFVFNSLQAATYYSNGSNAPNLVSSWKVNADGSGASPTNFTTANDVFVVQAAHTMISTADWAVSGAGSSVSVYGVLVAKHALTATAWTFFNGSTFQHDLNGGTIPTTATWNSGSLLKVTGITSTIVTLPKTIGGSVEWNCPSQTVSADIYTSVGGGTTFTVGGNFTVNSTGTGAIWFYELTGQILNIGGNYRQNNGAVVIEATGTNDIQIINIAGSYTFVSGVFNFSNSTGNIITLFVGGNWTMTGGTITETSSSTCNFKFNGSSTQSFVKSGGTISNTINFEVVSGAVVDFGTSVLNGSNGTFILGSGAGIYTAHAQGLSATTATGSVQVTGARTFNAGANYTYTGTEAQVTGIGLPAAISGSLTINNTGVSPANTVTLSRATAVSGSMLLINGILVTTTTNTLNITNTANTALLGGSTSTYVNGPLNWSFPINMASSSTYQFPVGAASYLPFSVKPTTGSSAANMTVQAFSANSGGSKGTLSSISTSEYWGMSKTNVTAASISLGRGTGVYPYDLVAGSISKTGTYVTLGGTSSYYTVANSNAIGFNTFFVLASSGTPIVNLSAAVFGSFGYIYNFGPSLEQSFLVNATSLSSNLLITAPAEFEISTTSGVGFTSSISLGTGNINNTTIYIRLKAGLLVGDYYLRSLTFVSGTLSKSLSCSGIVFSTTPTIYTSGGRTCTGDSIKLFSSSENITILYWTGPNSFYSKVQNPVITPTTSAMNGTYTVTGSLPTGPNLIINGDFESGNTGFTSSYGYVLPTATPVCYSQILGCQGSYTIVADPISVHTDFTSSNDHSDPGTLQMVINGATAANVPVWSQTVAVIPNSNYQFSYWVQSVHPTFPSQLQLFANNMAVGTTYTATATGGFTQFIYNWNSGSSSTVVLELRNQNTAAGGNDFALDDIIFRTVQQVFSSVVVSANNIPAVTISTPTTVVTAGENATFAATPTNGGANPLYQWYVNGVAVGTNSASSTLKYVPAQGDVISCVLTSDKSCADPKTATSNTITMTVTTVGSNYWIGTNGTDWGVTSNWTANKVPTAGDNVEFATIANNTVAAKNDLYVDFNRIVGNLINNASGRNLVIPTDKELIVNNRIVLTPVSEGEKYNQIYIKSENSKVNGSLVFYNPFTSSVPATVEMYSKAQYFTPGVVANGTTYHYTWQFFGVPMTSVTANPTFAGSYVRIYNEASNVPYGKWTQLTNSSVLKPFKGYEITQYAPKTIYFSGILVNRDTTILLPTTSGAYDAGQHILSNPYAAAIDIRKLRFGVNTDSVVYLYNTGSFAAWYGDGINTGVSDNNNGTPGQYLSIPKNVAGQLTIPYDIPSMQGFLIIANNNLTGSITIPYAAVATKNIKAQRAKSETTLKTCLKLTVESKSSTDQVWLFREDGTKKGYDNGWDGFKMLNGYGAAQVFAVEDSINYQISTSDDLNESYIGFIPGGEVEYTISNENQNVENEYESLYLVDLVENKTIDITQSGAKYAFVADSSSIVKRFKVVAELKKQVPEQTTALRVYSAEKTIFINNVSGQKGKLIVYDIAGRIVKQINFDANVITTFNLNSASGAYVVSAYTADDKVESRIIIR